MNNHPITHLRLHSQRISGSQFVEPQQILSWLGAIQGQDYPGALWSIGLRTPGSTKATVEQAIIDRKIVRSWLMRGTLHFCAAEDLRWMLGLVAPRNISGQRARDIQLGLDEKTYAQSYEVLARALQGDNCLTRLELLQTLEQSGISTKGQRGYHILKRAGQDKLICFGPMRDKQQTFVLLDEWLPHTQDIDHDEALAKLALQYFRGRGPATIDDFIWWSGLLRTDARNGLEVVKSKLEREIIDGKEYWFMPGSSDQKAATQSAYLLPGFDEYILGYKDRSAVLEPQYNQRICPGGNGMFVATIVNDGQVIGTWRRGSKRSQSVVPTFFTPAYEERAAALDMPMERYNAFLDKRAS